jgi:mono/diheme cytochrome c family protein
MRLVLRLPIIIAALAAGPAQAQTIGDPGKGQEISVAKCGECHAVLAGQSPSPVRGVPAFQAIADTPGMTAAALTVFFRSHHRGMPSIMLSQDEQDHLIAYITGLKR